MTRTSEIAIRDEPVQGEVVDPRRRQQPSRGTGRKAVRPGDVEWAMIGMDVDAGKRLYASRDLKGAAFGVAVNEHTYDADGWHFTGTLQKMLIITKPTYGECLAELMQIWENWDRNEQAERELAERDARKQLT